MTNVERATSPGPMHHALPTTVAFRKTRPVKCPVKVR
jgi:hypothetical protein